MREDVEGGGPEAAEDPLEPLLERVRTEEARLGAGFFQEEAGRFGQAPRANPYLEARSRLVEALWAAGRLEEGVAQARELLALDGQDRHSNRVVLAQMLLEAGRLEEVQALLEDWRPRDQDTTWWSHSRLLLAIRREEDGAQALLVEALRCNPHGLEFLLDPALPPRGRSGDLPREAWEYARLARANWHEDGASALRWVAGAARPSQPVSRPPRTGRNEPCWCGSGLKTKKCHPRGGPG